MNALSQISSLRTCEPAVAVQHFLAAMSKAATTTFPAWHDVLKSAIDERKLPYDVRRAAFEIQPLADFHLAGVVGMEAARIRALFPTEIAQELLSVIAETVDGLAQRSDRLVSAVVFDVVGDVNLLQSWQHRLPHDEVVRIILERMGWNSMPEMQPLFGDILFRHQLGEPLARGVPQWWSAFHNKFVIAKAGATAMQHATVAVQARTARRLI